MPLPPRSRELARRAAEESFVLLRNEPVKGEPLLPLKLTGGQRIALIGPHADDAREMLGSWAIRGRDEDVVTLKTALIQRLAPGNVALLCAKGTAWSRKHINRKQFGMGRTVRARQLRTSQQECAAKS